MLAAAAVLAFLVAGCGGGDDVLTKAEFVEQGDAICKETPIAIASGYKAFAKEQGLKQGEFPDQAAGYEVAEDIYLPAEEHQLEALRELNPPLADRDRVDAMLTKAEARVASARKNPKLLLVLGKNPLLASTQEYKSYGFKVCGTV